MKFTIQRKDALRLRQTLSSFRWDQEYDVVSLVAEDGLTVTGGNDKQGFRMEILAKIKKPGSNQYAASRLSKALAGVLSGDLVEFSASPKTARLTIKSGGVKTAMASRTGLVVPPPPASEPDAIAAQKPLSAALSFTDFAAADKPEGGKDFLLGASLRQYEGGDALAVERTDGTKYAMALAPAKFRVKNWEAVLPPDGIRLLKLVKPKDGLLSLGLSGGKFWIRGDLLVWSAVYADKFPNVMGMVKIPETPFLAIETADYISQILSALDGVDEDKNIVRISGWRMEVPANTAEQIPGETLLLASEGEVLSVSATAQASIFRDADVSLNAGYLATAMRKMRPPVYFYQAAPNAPVFLKEKGADRLIMLLPFAVREQKPKKETDF